MFFVVNVARPAGIVATVFGPFPTQEAAEKLVKNARPGTYQVFGPAVQISEFNVSQPVVTEKSI